MIRTPGAGRGWNNRGPTRPIPSANNSIPVATAIQQNKKESDFLVPMLPFDTKIRSVQEYKARSPHRRFINEKMLRIRADWVDAEVGDLDLYANTNAIEITDDSPVEDTETKQPESSDCVNARVFLNSPLLSEDQPERHILHRIDILGSSVITTTRQLRTYGGNVPAGTKSEIINSLIEVVKSQCGLDLSSVKKWTQLGTIEYEVGNPPTTFFYPHVSTSESKLIIRSLIKTTTETFDEEVETEDPETTTMVKTIETRKKSNVNRIMTPIRMSLATLRDYALAATTHHETYELCVAVDLFDEWIRRDFVTKIANTLTERLSATDYEVEAENRIRLRKKRLSEEEVSCKRRKESKILILKKQWELDDVGKTDEDKKDVCDTT